jgi:hypothetical protein
VNRTLASRLQGGSSATKLTVLKTGAEAENRTLSQALPRPWATITPLLLETYFLVGGGAIGAGAEPFAGFAVIDFESARFFLI